MRPSLVPRGARLAAPVLAVIWDLWAVGGCWPLGQSDYRTVVSHP